MGNQSERKANLTALDLGNAMQETILSNMEGFLLVKRKLTVSARQPYKSCPYSGLIELSYYRSRLSADAAGGDTL